MTNRLLKVHQKLKKNKLAAFVVSDPVNIYYLSGFSGITPSERESILIVDQKKIKLVVHRMYAQEASRLSGVEAAILPPGTRMFEFLAESLKGLGPVGFEENNLRYSEYKFLKKKRVKLIGQIDFIEDVREVKDPEELKLIKHAASVTDKVFSRILEFLKPGIKEEEAAKEILRQIESFGADKAFSPIVASGPNSAKPHHIAGKRKLRRGEPVLLDFGARYKRYRADMTRTVYLGKAPEEFKKNYSLVLKAQLQATQAIGPKKPVGRVHQEVLEVLEEKAEWFTHNTGHGVGLEIHENPSIGLQGKDLLEEGMVVTVEPGLYVPGKYGIRIEDMGVVVKEGFKAFSKSSRKLLEI